MVRVLLVDHHDSYAHILRHVLIVAGATQVDVVSHDDEYWGAPDADYTCLLGLDTPHPYDLVVLSPGPGSPENPADVGIAWALLDQPVPVWGVCLGHQVLVAAAGGRVHQQHTPSHGVVSRVHHAAEGLWEGIPQDTPVVRYHSWAVEAPLPKSVVATAWSEEGTIMAVEQQGGVGGAPRWGVQFHPESIDTPYGVQMVTNVLHQAKAFGRVCGAEIRNLDGQQVAEVLRDLSLPGESLRWLDDSLGGEESVVALCGQRRIAGTGDVWGLLRQGETSGEAAYPYAGWIGALSYEADSVDFAHTEIVVWGSEGGWSVAGADTARVAEVRVRLREVADSPTMARNTHGGSCLSGWDQRVADTGDLPALISAVGVDEAHYARVFVQCQRLLSEGQSYELCLTDTVVVPRCHTRNPWEAYVNLRRACPTHYGAYLELGRGGPVEAIVSASPELFVKVSKTGVVTTRPMKGTAARVGDDSVQDAAVAAALQSDHKTRAENLMVIDLARSDLARVCQPGSVRVIHDRVVETYETVHQLVTEIQGQLRCDQTALDAVQACFPPASMTGAPKERTVQLLRDLECQPRGVYSGCAGFLGDDGDVLLSVLIRTAVYEEDVVRVGAGGAITADSTMAEEYAELTHKASYVVGEIVDPHQCAVPVVDSFILVEGEHGGVGRDEYSRTVHARRFRDQVAVLYGEDEARRAAEFYQQCLDRLPSQGQFFPQIRWEDGVGLAQLDRACPNIQDEIVAALGVTLSARLAAGDPRRFPQIKGPDMGLLAQIRQQGQQRGADEVVLCDRWGQVLEGTHSAVLWWEGEVLCGPPHVAVLESTMRRFVEEQARQQGFKVQEKWLPASELPQYRVWSVNALHGVREVVGWV